MLPTYLRVALLVLTSGDFNRESIFVPTAQSENLIMKIHHSYSFYELDFDELASMAATNLEKFEELRSTLIEQAISRPGSNSEQLKALQCRLNQESGTLTPRYLACLQLSEWLDEPYRQLRLKLDDVRSLECCGSSLS